MKKADKIAGMDDAWDKDGMLGNDAAYAALADPETQKAIEDALSMQMISIRLPRSVIDTFKALAVLEGIKYQPMMREALIRFANGKARRILMDAAAQQTSQRRQEGPRKASSKTKKAA